MVKRKHLNGKRSRLNERMKPIWPISSGRQMKCICNSSLLGKQRKREVHFWERNTNTFWERCIRTKSTEERCTRKKCTKERYTDTFCAMRPLMHLALLLGWSEITRGWGKVILYFIFIVIIYYALLINRGYISVLEGNQWKTTLPFYKTVAGEEFPAYLIKLARCQSDFFSKDKVLMKSCTAQAAKN